MKAFSAGVLLVFLFLFFPKLSLAVNTTLINPPSSITSDPFTVQVSITGAQTGTNHLRVDLYKDGTTNYFGETYNGTSWYAGSDASQYFPITIQSGATSSATFQGRIGTPTSSQYNGTGSYKLRIRRYTSSGSYTTSEANNSAVVVSINVATPTPTPSPTPSPTQTTSPTYSPQESIVPSATDQITPIEELTFVPNPTTISINLFEKASSSSKSVLPLATKSAFSSPKSKKKEFLAESEINPSKILMIVGILIILGSLGFLAKSFLK